MELSDKMGFEDKKDIQNDPKNTLIEYDPSDNKFENFSLKKMKKIKSFTTETNISKIIVLNDGRLLCHLYEYDYGAQDFSVSKFCVYNIKNEIICDINENIYCSIGSLFKIEKNKIITLTTEEDKDGYLIGVVRIYQIEEKSIERINLFTLEYYDSLRLLSDNKILVRRDNDFPIYLYENNSIKESEDFRVEFEELESLKIINPNEIVLYCFREKIS